MPVYGASAYSASKFALDGFFNTLRFELKSEAQPVPITVCNLGVIGKFSIWYLTCLFVKMVPSIMNTDEHAMKLLLKKVYINSRMWWLYKCIKVHFVWKYQGAFTRNRPTRTRKRVCYVLIPISLQEKTHKLNKRISRFLLKWNWYKKITNTRLSFFEPVSDDRASMPFEHVKMLYLKF